MNKSFIQRMAALALKPNRIPKTETHSFRCCLVPNSSVSTSLSTPNFKSSTKHQYRSFSAVAKKGSVIATGPDGTQYDIPLKPLGDFAQTRHAPKLAPRFKKARIAKLRIAEGKTKNIRHSPWRLNLICQFAAGKTVPEAMIQLKFCEKVKAPLVTTLLQRTVNTARQKYGLLPSQLEVAECFATHGTHLKRVKIMGRGRAGKKLRRFSHMRIVLREIDFPLKIMTSTSMNQRNKWIKKMEIALEDQVESQREQEEIEKLEKELEEARKKTDEKS
jgi:large subunit ribosomal protein L22